MSLVLRREATSELGGAIAWPVASAPCPTADCGTQGDCDTTNDCPTAECPTMDDDCNQEPRR